ncbi:hypothetical protein RRG08_048603 [Elysia crispata]|uniref:Uncharacterized protein n=1 Tax=Elysia crispata TaxID=231223 RepID=A0AAE1AD79_9GAST|nr:hypothetical protein RRG08_048603 [Elysia crispata]
MIKYERCSYFSHLRRLDCADTERPLLMLGVSGFVHGETRPAKEHLSAERSSSLRANTNTRAPRSAVVNAGHYLFSFQADHRRPGVVGWQL